MEFSGPSEPGSRSAGALRLDTSPVDPMSDPEWEAFCASVPAEPRLSAEEVLAELLPDPLPAASALPAAGETSEWPSPRLVDDTEPGPLLAALMTEVDVATCSDDALVGLVGAGRGCRAAAGLGGVGGAVLAGRADPAHRVLARGGPGRAPGA